MQLSGFQNVVWVSAGAAAFVFTWLLRWSDGCARNMGDLAVVAKSALTDQPSTIRNEEDFAAPETRRALAEKLKGVA